MKRMKLAQKFTWILAVVFLGGIILCALALWQELLRRAEAEISQRSKVLIESMIAVRSYTDEYIAPLMQSRQDPTESFQPEMIPNFSAYQVAKLLRQQRGYNAYIYKEASRTPRNPNNQADAFETWLLEQMQDNPDKEELSGYRRINDQRIYYTARPMWAANESCLKCHSTPENAPPGLVETYGLSAFGWEVGQLAAAQIVYVPAEDVLQDAWRAFGRSLGIIIVTAMAVLLLVRQLVRRQIVFPVEMLGGLAQKIGADSLNEQDLHSQSLEQIAHRTDELGDLATIFRRMAQEVYDRVGRLKRQVHFLRIQIDGAQRKQQVKQVMSSDFFSRVREKGRLLREQRKAQERDNNTLEEGQSEE